MDGGGAEEAGAGQHEKAGRALVRALLVGRLAEAGLTRAKGQTEAALAAMQDRLCDWLGYLTRDELLVLADQVIGAAKDGKWPSEAVIRDMAGFLRRKPLEKTPIFVSWFTSIEGPRLLAEGLLVETYQFLRDTPRKPLVGDWKTIRAAAERNNRDVTQFTEWRARGAATASQLAWLADYQRELARLTALVAEGQERRLAGVQG